MSEYAHFLLDALIVIGGGNGSLTALSTENAIAGTFGDQLAAPGHNLSHFFFALILWLLILVSAWTITRVRAPRRESILLWGLSLGAGRELLMLVTQLLKLRSFAPESNLYLIVPPLEHALVLSAHILIATAFLFYLLDHRESARRYLRFTVTAGLGFYLLAVSLWWVQDHENSSLQFSGSGADWFAHLWGASCVLLAIILLARSRSVRPLMICIPFALFFMDDLLTLASLLTHGHQMADLIALGNTFHIMALPCLAYVYWREQVDEQDRLSMQLVQSGRIEIAGQLGSGVAHDFNNHLQAILGHAQTPANTSQNPQSESQRFELISESVEKASNLIHQLLALNADNVAYRIEVLDINELLRSLSPMLESQLKPNQKIDLQLDGNTTTVVANRVMIEQSIINLINNARDALHDEGKITIRSVFQPQPEPGQSRSYGVQLSITDNGSGMDAKTLNQIYEPFFTTKGVGKGTGLGLSSVYNYMRRIGGQIRVDSQAGVGTTVKLNFPEPNLPATTANEPNTLLGKGKPEVSLQNQHTASDDLPPTVGSQASILLAEGNAAIRNTAAAQLRSAGYGVTAVSNGEAAIQCLRSSAGNRFDLLLLDVSLPLLAGYEVFDTAHDLYPGIQVVFLSEPGQHTSSQLTEHAHLLKPFHREQLLSTIRGTLKTTAS